jgi:hypothetical protein
MAVNKALNCRWKVTCSPWGNGSSANEAASVAGEKKAPISAEADEAIAKAKKRVRDLVDILAETGQTALWEDISWAGREYARVVTAHGRIAEECSETYFQERVLRVQVQALFDKPSEDGYFEQVFREHMAAMVYREALTGVRL